MFWNIVNPERTNQFFIQFIGDNAITNNSILFWIFVLLGLLMSITIHEWAHAYSAHLLGDDTAKNDDRMNINPLNHFDALGLGLILFTFIGYGKPVPVNGGNFINPARDMMLVSLAGPASNFLLAFLCGISYLALKPFVGFDDNFTGTQGILMGFIATFVYSLGTIGFYNLGLMVFNMLPIPPLDGRKVWGYVHYNINGFLMRYVDPYWTWILIIFILPIFGTLSLTSLISIPFFLLYSIAFGVYQ